MNIIEKAVAQNRLYRWFILRKPGDRGAGQIVDMEVGKAYIFWGYRSLHANVPCQPGAVRATLLVHFGRLRSGSSALTTAIRLQQLARGIGVSNLRDMALQRFRPAFDAPATGAA